MTVQHWFRLLFVLILIAPGWLQAADDSNMLGLPALVVPADNPITKEKVALGDKLYNDKRFSSTGKIACMTCHDPKKGFTDNLRVSKGIKDLTGTRNSPTVFNAAYMTTQFWDGRSPSLEEQAQHPMVNPVEMGLADHNPVMKIVKEDPAYIAAFKAAFNVEPKDIVLDHVLKAIATFERTQVGGNSRFDRWYFNGQSTLSEQEKRGFDVFIGNGRCVSCHTVEHTTALFTDNKFHNIGVGINRVPAADIDRLVAEFIRADYSNETVDKKVLTDKKTSEIGRVAVTQKMVDIGNFKTPTLRNVALTAPYMHDGSLKTLEEVVEHYNRGGKSSDAEKLTPYLSGGIRPLNLTPAEKAQLVAFMKTLNSAKLAKK